MAYAKSSAFNTVLGNKRAVAFVLEADAASGAVDTGLGVIESVQVTPKSAATAAPLIKANQNSGTTALNGSLFIKNAASGDDFHVICIGT